MIVQVSDFILPIPSAIFFTKYILKRLINSSYKEKIFKYNIFATTKTNIFIKRLLQNYEIVTLGKINKY